jgi:hypothetical protein
VGQGLAPQLLSYLLSVCCGSGRRHRQQDPLLGGRAAARRLRGGGQGGPPGRVASGRSIDWRSTSRGPSSGCG